MPDSARNRSQPIIPKENASAKPDNLNQKQTKTSRLSFQSTNLTTYPIYGDIIGLF